MRACRGASKVSGLSTGRQACRHSRVFLFSGYCGNLLFAEGKEIALMEHKGQGKQRTHYPTSLLHYIIRIIQLILI